ncbi:hypothetical protein EYS14_10065 [Alteromonadaceae bacterium M269]|nr:hypothetical protein EYS14_10065 [Alteromonadaceae bacterium M269]
MTERNPLIETHPEDTLINLHTVVTLIQDLHTNDQFMDLLSDNKNMHIALSLILKCTNDALEYEISRIEALQRNKGSFVFEA